MALTTPITCWYIDLHLYKFLHTSIFRNGSDSICRRTNTTVFISWNCSLNLNFNSFIVRFVYFRLKSYIDCRIIRSWLFVVFVFNIGMIFILLLCKRRHLLHKVSLIAIVRWSILPKWTTSSSVLIICLWPGTLFKNFLHPVHFSCFNDTYILTIYIWNQIKNKKKDQGNNKYF